MQFVAFGPHWVAVRPELEAVYDSKDRLTRPRQRRLYARFDDGAAPAFAVDIAAREYGTARVPGGSSLRRECSFYDSFIDQQRMGWTDEEREAIEQKLLSRPGVVRVEVPRAGKPWPTYHQVKKAEAVAAIATDLGLVREALAYERDRENPRPAFIKALEEAAEAAAPAVEEDEVVEA